MAERKLTPERARQLHRKVSAELQAVYQDSLVQGSQAFRTSDGSIKQISRERPSLSGYCVYCHKLLDTMRKYCDDNLSRSTSQGCETQSLMG
jgi:hypothetical protein